jgi:GNAT superfamily N-acetyltransferase
MIDELESRLATDADLPAILELLRLSMGRGHDDRFSSLFRWKHLENPFGRSPMWVACDDGRIVGLRTLMRWEFERDGQTARCVRAVDTATHPDYQGRGIFRQLTLAALPELERDGVQFVFNTPNTQSRPGYLKMGWTEIGRAAACVRPLSIGGALRLARNRVPAAHWSEPTTFGRPVDEVVGDPDFAALLANREPAPGRFRTRADVSFVTWRYGTPLLGYRAVVAPEGVEHGTAFVRRRRRGAARELVLAMLLTPTSKSPSARRGLVREVVRQAKSEADYVLGVGSIPGCVRVRSFGPIMTTRDVSVAAPREVAAFQVELGDLELF